MTDGRQSLGLEPNVKTVFHRGGDDIQQEVLYSEVVFFGQ